MTSTVTKFGLAIALFIGGASTAIANEKLEATEIKSTISGKRIMLETQWGGFPMRYQSNGKVVGDGSALGLGRFFSPKETGSWWVSGDQLCQKFPTWYNGRQFCFTLQRIDDSRLRWQRDDGRSGTARITG